MIEAILVEGLVYGILAIAVFMTFRILDFPDLTVEGSFPLGAACAASAVVAGIPFPLAALLAFGAGSLAGAATASIHARFRVPPLLAGIVVMTALYSINLRIMGGRSNIQLVSNRPLVDFARTWIPALPSEWAEASFFALISIAIIFLLDLFFHTEFGLTLGALGDNPRMVTASGSNPDAFKTAGVALSNAMAALAGAFASQHHGLADVNLGSGVVALGLASVMIGELLFRTNRIGGQLLRAVLGATLFKSIMFGAASMATLQALPPTIYGW
ncbi:ABC transporter permease [Treponema sp.]